MAPLKLARTLGKQWESTETVGRCGVPGVRVVLGDLGGRLEA